MNGICPDCQRDVIKDPGAEVYCPHNEVGSLYAEMLGQKMWICYGPIARHEFSILATFLKNIISPPAAQVTSHD